MISSKMNRDSLLEAVVFNEVMKEIKRDRMRPLEFIKGVAKNFGFWFHMVGNDLEDL